MSRRLDYDLRCDHPGCIATVTVHPSGRPMPADWWYCDRTIRGTHACPAHAAEAKAVQLALHKWEVREVAARNAWRKKNPPPEVPEWLEDIVP